MTRALCPKCEGWGEVACPVCKGRKPSPFFHTPCRRCDDEDFIPCDCDGGYVETKQASEPSPVLPDLGDVEVIER